MVVKKGFKGKQSTHVWKHRKGQTKKSVIFPWVVCGIGALFYSYEFFLRIAPSVITTQLTEQFHITAGQLGTLGAIYYFAYAPMQLPVGLLMDHYSPRKLLSLACFFCAIGAMLFAVPIYSVAGGGRFIVGFGSAFAFVGVLKLASIWLPPNRFGLISGLVTALGMMGAMSGDVLLTELIETIGWYHTILFSSLIGFVLAIVMWVSIRDHANRPRRMEKKHAGTSFKELFHGLVLLFKRPQIWINGIIGCFLFSPLTALGAMWGIQYLKQAYHFSKMDAGLAISMIFLGFAIGGVFAGWISDRIKRRKLPITIGSAFAALFSFALIYMPGLSMYSVYFLLLMIGISSGAQVLVFAIATESCEHRLAGTVIALTNFLVMIGGAIFQPFIGAMLDLHFDQVHAQLDHFSIVDYQYALSIVPVGMLISMVLSLFLKETGAKNLKSKS